jgi:hypothetical protein
MDFDTIRLPPPILQHNSTSDKQIIFKIHNKYNEDFCTNNIINKLKNIHLSSNITDIKYQKVKVLGEHDFKNIN